MANYQEARVTLTSFQLNELKSAAKNKTGTTLRITQKNVQDEKLPHELFLTIRQKNKIKNVFANNMFMDIKLIETQISEIIQSGRFLGSWLGKLGTFLTDFAISFAKNNFPGLVRNLASNAVVKEE